MGVPSLKIKSRKQLKTAKHKDLSQSTVTKQSIIRGFKTLSEHELNRRSSNAWVSII